jgi:hypothetical protein
MPPLIAIKNPERKKPASLRDGGKCGGKCSMVKEKMQQHQMLITTNNHYLP